MDTEKFAPSRLSRVLRMDSIPAHEVVGGAQGLARPVTQVAIGTEAGRLAGYAAGTLVVFDRDRLRVEDPDAELALRLARSQNLAGIVAARPPAPLPRSTILLADKFGIPLILAEGLDAAALVAAVDPFVREPELAGARSVQEFIQRIRSGSHDPEALVQVIERVAGGRTAIIDSEGRVLNGEPTFMDGVPEEVNGIISRQRPAPTEVTGDGEIVVLQPAATRASGQADLWLATRSPSDSPVLRQTIAQILTIASLAFSAHIARQMLGREREDRERTLLLTEILEEGANPTRETVEHASAFGWRLSGWHMGVHLAVSQSGGPAPHLRLIPAIESALAQRSVPASLVERPDGWVFWVSYDLEPRPGDLLDLTQTMRRALLHAARVDSSLNISAGIGRPYPGTAGISRSLAEAQQACLLAQTSEHPVSVEHIDALNVKALLTRWYASTAVRETAGHLLAPLFATDPSGDLVRTLRCYLDNSSSTTATAAALGIHRNTVIQRLAKIRSVLPLDLDRADERLVAHLATRGSNIERETG